MMPQTLPKGKPEAAAADLAVKTLQMLAVDAVEKARSGHPGLPMGAADFATVLWTRHLRFQPQDPLWPDRDRFLLSAGHGSMLLYALLHLSGYDLPMEELQRFRQWGSRTPGHPEHGLTPGVETTTGPLGQGFANGVGMAIGARILAHRFRGAGEELFRHRIFGIVSDGDLMEGVASEAASLAGHLGLGNLIYFFDDNKVTIDGSTEITFTEDVRRRFEAYGWQVLAIDGHDRAAIDRALAEGISEKDRPTLIAGRTIIGKGNPVRQGTRKAHSDAFGPDEVKATKENVGWPQAPAFLVPEEVRAFFRARAEEVRPEYDAWQARWKGLSPDLRAQRDRLFSPALPADLEERLVAAAAGPKPMATRNASEKAIQAAAAILPGLVGGSADLAASNKTAIAGSKALSRGDFEGRNIHFGVREHAMGSILNGLALHGGFRPFGGTFLVFADYMRPAIRLAALMELPVAYVFTHDSIFVGEDGPTHEPIEHLPALRCIPNLLVLRPADARETALAWAAALRRTDGPTALVLSRQDLPPLEWKGTGQPPLSRGAYVVKDAPEADLLLMASGSEVHVALAAAAALEAKRGLRIRVVSMPSPGLFGAQDAAYRESVLPAACRKRVSIEAASTYGWDRHVGPEGLSIGIDRFGASAPYQVLAEKFGLTPAAVTERIEAWLDGKPWTAPADSHPK